jgi:hypothetical protein
MKAKSPAPGSPPEVSPNVTYAPPAGSPEREVWQKELETEELAALMNGTRVAQRTVRLHHNGSHITVQKRFKDGPWSQPRPVFPSGPPKLSRRGRVAAQHVRRVHRTTALPRRTRGCNGRPARRPNRRSRSAQSRAPGDEGQGEGDGPAGPHRLNAPLERPLAGRPFRRTVAGASA